MKLLGLIAYFGPIEVTKFLSFISEGVISLSTLSVHFRNWSIISIVFEANQKMCWEKLTLYWYKMVSQGPCIQSA